MKQSASAGRWRSAGLGHLLGRLGLRDRGRGFMENHIVYAMNWIPPGTFVMGSPAKTKSAAMYRDEGPQHEVTLTRGFWMAEWPCTQALWTRRDGQRQQPLALQSRPMRPVENVSWEEAQDFLQRLNERHPGLRSAPSNRSGVGVRLPRGHDNSNLRQDRCRATTLPKSSIRSPGMAATATWTSSSATASRRISRERTPAPMSWRTKPRTPGGSSICSAIPMNGAATGSASTSAKRSRTRPAHTRATTG